MKAIKIIKGLLMLLSVNAAAQSFDHSLLNVVLRTYVKDGLVNYRSLKTDKTLLSQYLNKVQNLSPEEFGHWNKNEQKAFWINVYNAITLEGILRKYPIRWGGLVARVRFPKSSIRQIKNFWDKVFVKVMGHEMTLNQIEHEILRKQFGDPRIHFAIVCASIGCPKLASFAFDGQQLNDQLERVTREFINDHQKVILAKENNILYLSSSPSRMEMGTRRKKLKQIAY